MKAAVFSVVRGMQKVFCDGNGREVAGYLVVHEIPGACGFVSEAFSCWGKLMCTGVNLRVGGHRDLVGRKEVT